MSEEKIKNQNLNEIHKTKVDKEMAEEKAMTVIPIPPELKNPEPDTSTSADSNTNNNSDENTSTSEDKK